MVLSIWQLAALLDHCDVMFAEHLENAYHISIFSGCTGQLMWSPFSSLGEPVHGQVARQWRLVMGPLLVLGFLRQSHERLLH